MRDAQTSVQMVKATSSPVRGGQVKIGAVRRTALGRRTERVFWSRLSGPQLSRPLRELFRANGTRAAGWAEAEAIVRAPDVAPGIADRAAGLLQDEAAFASFGDSRRVTGEGSAPERLAFYAASRLIGRKAFERRRRALEALPSETSPLDALRIDRRTGVLVTEQGGWGPVEAAVTEARRAFAAPDRQHANAAKPFLATARIPGEVLDSDIMALGLEPSVLRLAGRYLEGLPILYRINLLESSNDHLEDASSQFFHLDPEDFRQVKIFMLVEDVDEHCGPLHLLEAGASDQVRLKLGHRHGRLADDAVMDIAAREALVRCAGPAGTLAIGDTSRCFHYGSRPGRRRRYVVMYQYVTPFACSFPIDAREVSSKYAQQIRRREAERGGTLPEQEALVFGLER